MRITKIIKNCSSSLCTCLHHMVILRTRNKITDFLIILAWASPFKKTLASHISLVTSSGHTHLHRYRKRWASVRDVGPALIQHWFNASCLLCLAIIGLEQFWASVNVRQWWDSYGSLAIGLIKCPYIAYRASPLSLKHTRGVQPMLDHRCRR